MWVLTDRVCNLVSKGGPLALDRVEIVDYDARPESAHRNLSARETLVASSIKKLRLCFVDLLPTPDSPHPTRGRALPVP